MPASTPVATPAPVAQVPAPVPTPTVQIAAYGDDSMEGLTAQYSGYNPQNETVVAQQILQAQFSDPNIGIGDMATGGTSSSLCNEIRGMDGNGPPFAIRMQSSTVNVVVDNHAVHDDLGGETLDDYRRCLAQWVVDVRQAGKTPVLEEPNPTCDGDHPRLGDYVATMDSVAAIYNVPLIKQYDFLLTVPNYCSHLSAGFFPDDAIYAIKAQREAAVLAPLVKQIIGGQS